MSHIPWAPQGPLSAKEPLTIRPWPIVNQPSVFISKPSALKLWSRIRPCWKHLSLRRMPKFPVDAPRKKVISALELLGFRVVREREHISMVRENADGTRTPLTMPNHSHIKG